MKSRKSQILPKNDKSPIGKEFLKTFAKKGQKTAFAAFG